MIFLSLWWPTASSVFTRVNFSWHSSVSNVVGKDLFIFVILEIWNPQHIPNCVTRPVCYMKSVLLRLQSNFYLVLLTSKRLFSLHFLTNNEVNSSSSTTLSLLLFLLFLLFLWLAKIDYSDLTLKLVSFSTIWMEDWLCLKQTKKKLQAIISNREETHSNVQFEILPCLSSSNRGYLVWKMYAKGSLRQEQLVVLDWTKLGWYLSDPCTAQYTCYLFQPFLYFFPPG